MTMRLAVVALVAAVVTGACGADPTSSFLPTAVSPASPSSIVGAKSSVNVATASSTITVPADAVATGTTPSDTSTIPTAPVEPTVQVPTTAPEGTPKWSLAIKVVNGATGAPLSGVAMVILDGPNAGSSGTSDLMGMVTFPALWNSAFTVSIPAGTGYNSLTRSVMLTGDTSFEVAVDTLWMLSGRVLKEHGAPLAGATVSVVDGPNAGRSATSGADGSYSISGLRWGGFTARATKSGFNVVSAGVHLRTDTVQDFVGLNEQAPPTTTPPGTGTPGGNTPGGTTTVGGGSFNGSVSLTVSSRGVIGISISGCRSFSTNGAANPLPLSGSGVFDNGRLVFSWSVSGSSASGQIQYLGADQCAWDEWGMKSWSGSVSRR